MKAAIILFPGSNREGDAARALRQAGASASIVWHAEHELPAGTDLVVLPGAGTVRIDIVDILRLDLGAVECGADHPFGIVAARTWVVS